MDGILQIVTDKLIELMFDSKTGWAADPEREAVVERDQIQRRQERGFLTRLFKGSGNQQVRHGRPVRPQEPQGHPPEHLQPDAGEELHDQGAGRYRRATSAACTRR